MVSSVSCMKISKQIKTNVKEDILIWNSLGLMIIINRLEIENLFINPIYQPLRSGRIWHKVNFLKRSLTVSNSEFSFS